MSWWMLVDFMGILMHNIFRIYEGADNVPTIKSSTDLRNNYNSISTYCHESREPVFITKNGRGDLAVMSIEVYEALRGKVKRFPRPTPEEKKAAMREFRELMSPIDGSSIDIKELRAERREAKYERNA